MGIFGAAKKGFGMLGKGLKSSKTGAIKSIKPGVGGLKKSRKTFEELQKSVDTGKRLHGKERNTSSFWLNNLKVPDFPILLKNQERWRFKEKKLKNT